VLLLITGSLDGTADLIVRNYSGDLFRFNFDLFADYKLELRPSGWRVENPAGHSIDSENVKACLWWKAFAYPPSEHEDFINEEVKYIFREIYNWCALRGLVKGNQPDFHNRFGKINILGHAAEFFEIPDTLGCFNLAGAEKFIGRVVAKSFASGLTTTNKALFTTEVQAKLLDPKYPWYLQELIACDFDVTVFVCGDGFYSYRRDRRDLKGLDWRAEQNFQHNIVQWQRFQATEDFIIKIEGFCRRLGVKWGRLDFLERDGKMIFLEYNANGQWVFLEPEGSDFLVSRVVQYLRL